ncbi:hypothetical protein BCV70DRAFT_204480 [Testicularia cyperi]|uniref:Uncharacterized protein n=1 Tax=Testicularia cyperi TaxID=1882483 RepID=A0A317XZQ9_9BASI|nr:hypothetical protein BCV70DRAFT_204480 [Testicularia cyperi]
MASPTAIPNAQKSAHHHRPPPLQTTDLSGEIYASEGQRLSFSPPSSFYSRAAAAPSSQSLRIPVGMTSAVGPSSPTSRFSMGFSPINSGAVKPDDSRSSPPHCHTRARSHTAIGAGREVETWDDQLTAARPPTFNDSSSVTGSQASSYFSTADLSFSRSPTSPASSISSSVGSGYALGRVPSLPLGASYEQAQKRFNSGSWNQKMGWMNGMRTGPLSPTLTRGSIDEGSSADAGPTGAMGNLLRRFSLSGGGNPYRSVNGRTVAAPSNASAGGEAVFRPAAASAATAETIPRSVSPKAIPITRDSGVHFAEGGQPAQPAPVPRGRQPSFGSSAKRKPSPMGERLLMGHFTAH